MNYLIILALSFLLFPEEKMNFFIIITLSFIFFALSEILTDKIMKYIAKRKAKMLYNNIACQVKNLDINNNSMKGE